jgi:hypothetical protein
VLSHQISEKWRKRGSRKTGSYSLLQSDLRDIQDCEEYCQKGISNQQTYHENPRYLDRDQQVPKYEVTELLKVDPNTGTRRNGGCGKETGQGSESGFQ